MKTAPIGIAAAVLVLALSACSASPSSTGLSLADTKGSAQLTRNTISGQISSDITASISEVTDASEACGDDNDGLNRLWRSTALTELVPAATTKVTAIQQTIQGSFVSKGWESVSEPVGDDSVLVTLTNPDSLAVIKITAKKGTEDSASTIYVDITGP